MPEFPGQVRHSNASFPVIDLTDDANTQFNQNGKSPVKGIGVFSSIPNRTSVTSRYRTKGYLAVVGSTPYVYTSASTSDGDWATEGNWAGLSASNGIPSGGLTNNALVKLSDSDYDAGWTGNPIFTSTTLNDTAPTLLFGNTSATATADSSTLGKIEFKGVGSGNAQATGGKVMFRQSGAAGSTHVPTSIEFYTSTASDQNLAFSINNEKVSIFADNSSEPTAIAGGLYYNSTEENFYVGINE